MTKAMFGAGCFWGVEQAFRAINGVLDTSVGYTGGIKDAPTYQDVCTGTTGHAEVVEVTFDPNIVAYEDLLLTFWTCHNPTQVNRQGPDIGTQYRSAIFYYDESQRLAAQSSKSAADASGRHDRPIATEISPAPKFWRAEDYHQRYFEKQGITTCPIDG